MKIETPIAALTSQYKILLGSKSPRRKELLMQLDIPFEVVDIIGVNEIYPPELTAAEVPQYLAKLKFNGYRSNLTPKQLLITADTIVVNNQQILGKPSNTTEAIHMLTNLSGSTHQVITGVTIGTITQQISFSSTSLVHFSKLSTNEIKYYVNHYHPMDKAGAYGIQEWIGCVAVEGIEGSYYNVMGLPVNRLYQELKHFIPETK